MKPSKFRILNRIAKKSRADQLTRLIHLFVAKKISQNELLAELETLYNRTGEARSTLNSHLATSPPRHLAIGTDPAYLQVYDTIRNTYPRSPDLRSDLLESYTNTVSARAVTTERLSEYQNRGVEMVQVVAYIDHATTHICRMMNGRVFQLGPAAQTLQSQDPLVQSENFWQGNHHFSQTPTPDMAPWLPPYHYNCRTRIIPYIEPDNPFDAAIDRHSNLIPLEEDHVRALAENALSFGFATPELMHQHFLKHQQEYDIATNSQYMRLVSDLLKNPLKQMGLAISARDGRLNLYVWDPKVRLLDGIQKHDFAVFSLDNKVLKSFHAKNAIQIMENFDPQVHGKVMLLTDTLMSKGENMSVDALSVKQYEYIIDYFEDDDPTDELEIVSRLSFEKKWDTIPAELKKRILAVDATVLERYADWFDYTLFKRYIDTIRKRIEIENQKENQ